MNLSFSFIRSFFLLISIVITTAYTTTADFTPLNVLIGLLGGSLFALSLMAADYYFKKFNLRSFNIALIGLFFGFLMGEALLILFNNTLQLSTMQIEPETRTLIRTAIFLFSTYLGMSMTARAAEELYVSIPFVKFKAKLQNKKKKDLLIDSSLLQDSRFIDLAASGILDHQLILPKFMLKELYNQVENAQDNLNSQENKNYKTRRSLDIYKKLENMPNLGLRYSETDFHEIQDSTTKLIRLARSLDANIITSDSNKIQQSLVEGVSLINLNTLANALKPMNQPGEYINIKIQHPGKGARQGVGYLEDGTMVVINGASCNVGATIKAQVLSVKNTSAGRMIFCNSTDENLLSDQESAQSVLQLENAATSYYAL